MIKGFVCEFNENGKYKIYLYDENNKKASETKEFDKYINLAGIEMWAKDYKPREIKSEKQGSLL